MKKYYGSSVIPAAAAAFLCAFALQASALENEAGFNAFDTTIPVIEQGNEDFPVPKASVSVETGVRGISKGYISGNDSSAGVPTKPVEWVAIPAGKFTMGTDSGEKGFENAKPIHEVAIKTFDMSKTAVTVEQYAECVLKGGCTEPITGDYCNWGKTGRQLHPVNCVDWDQAGMYAKFKGGRLPSESEWEYAATSGGKNRKYPWGNDEPGCNRAVMYGNDGYGCGKESTMPVCSKTAGNTAQGLCDMAGNVRQWVQDTYQDSYKGAPTDGSVFEGTGPDRVLRGGSFHINVAGYLRAAFRSGGGHVLRSNDVGFRLVRSSPMAEKKSGGYQPAVELAKGAEFVASSYDETQKVWVTAAKVTVGGEPGVVEFTGLATGKHDTSIDGTVHLWLSIFRYMRPDGNVDHVGGWNIPLALKAGQTPIQTARAFAAYINAAAPRPYKAEAAGNETKAAVTVVFTNQ